MEDIMMLKHLSICAALIAVATSPANAQQQEAVLQRAEMRGVPIDSVYALPKPGRVILTPATAPDALIVHLIGSELSHSFDSKEKMLKALDVLQMPVCAFHVDGKVSKSVTPVAVYIVPKVE